MVPDSVVKKMTLEEQEAYIAALEANNMVLKEKNDLIEKLYNDNLKLQQELEELKVTHPVYQIKKMKETAEYVVNHKEEILQNPNNTEMLAKILQTATDNELDDEQMKDVIFKAFSMANKFRLQNDIEGTDVEKNIIIP